MQSFLKNSKRKIFILQERYFKQKLSKLHGQILELGYGSGDNFRYYSSNCNIIAIDKSINQNIQFNNITPIQKKIINELPFSDYQFDYVVFKFFLCSISNKQRIVNEMHRVLKENGQIIYMEHISSSNKIFNLIQSFLTPFTRIFYNNCTLNNSIDLHLKTLFERIERKQMDNHIEPYEFGIWKKQST